MREPGRSGHDPRGLGDDSTADGVPPAARSIEAPSDAELAAVQAIYDQLEQLLSERRPRCEMSGRCCNFESEEHQLWASELELAFALHGARGVVPKTAAGSCPWWREGLCTLREGRPLGCRIYFCDPGWATEMALVYERFHQQLRDVHQACDRPYSYRLFVDAVREAPAAERPSS